jgi:N,N-dimethylformamidase
VTVPAKTLVGYADRISLAACETIDFKVSSEAGAPYRAAIVRLINGDTNPAGPGYTEHDVPGAAWQLNGRWQVVHAGSCAVVERAGAHLGAGGFRVQMLIWPTTPEKSRQTLCSLRDQASGAGFRLTTGGQQGFSLQVWDGAGGNASIGLGAPLLARHWYRMVAFLDPVNAVIGLRQTALLPQLAARDIGEVSSSTRVSLPPMQAGSLIIAAEAREESHGFKHYFNGKIEAPVLARADGSLVGEWDFAENMASDRIHDTSPNALHGRLVQRPARAVTGHCWTGDENNWRHAPTQYGAIHFHDDDIDDAGWDTDFSWSPPASLPSGLYAARLNSADDEEYVPFVLRASRKRTGGLVFVVPTASYQAYANEHLAFDAALAELVHDHVPVFGANDLFLAAHRELGGSLYDRHSDGSGIFTSSRRRPILNMRPKYQSWLGGTGSGLWQLNADTHLLAWLEHEGAAPDCITDEDLDREGADALRGYRCVMLATHAEYWSTRMRDALETFSAEAGRIMHMGANGLYWRIAYHPDGSGTIEVRRCEVGNGWITAPGESYHAFTGEYGGLWRRIGRPPQQIAGVGFVGQGFDRCSYYRRLPASTDPRAAFIFDGVTDEIIGDFGLIGGGAAGIELDRTDPSLGTPPHALVLARSENHTPNYLPTVEELLINYVNQAEISPVTGEMVFYETPSGGAVFATGSIAWAGSLCHNTYRNNVAQISRNVLHRFLDPTPFTVKEHAHGYA